MEILNSWEMLSDVWSVLLVFTIIIGILAIYGACVSFVDGHYVWGTILTCVAVLCVVAVVAVCYSPKDTYHDVTIYDINQFDHEQYKIIEQKGKIFTIKEVK